MLLARGFLQRPTGRSQPGRLARAFEYWHNVDKDLGDRIEQGVRNQRSG